MLQKCMMNKAYSVKKPISNPGNSEQALTKNTIPIIFVFDKVKKELSYFKNNISA